MTVVIKLGFLTVWLSNAYMQNVNSEGKADEKVKNWCSFGFANKNENRKSQAVCKILKTRILVNN